MTKMLLLKSSLTFNTDIETTNYLTEQKNALNSQLQQISILKNDIMELYGLNMITEERLNEYLKKFFQSFKTIWDTQIMIYLIQIASNNYTKYLQPELTLYCLRKIILNEYFNSGEYLKNSLLVEKSVSVEYCLTIINKLISTKYFKENITEELIKL